MIAASPRVRPKSLVDPLARPRTVPVLFGKKLQLNSEIWL